MVGISGFVAAIEFSVILIQAGAIEDGKQVGVPPRHHAGLEEHTMLEDRSGRYVDGRKELRRGQAQMKQDGFGEDQGEGSLRLRRLEGGVVEGVAERLQLWENRLMVLQR